MCLLGLLAGFLVLVSGAAADTLEITDDIQTYTSLSDTTVTMSGQSELHLTDDSSPLTDCVINLNSEDSFLFLENITPSDVSSTYLSQVQVDGAAAVIDSNVRVVQYIAGAVVIPHGDAYTPLQIYTGFYYTGSSLAIEPYTLYTSDSLGSLDNTISSFKLKRGYMATFAQDEDGGGTSRVYIAQDSDINLPLVPEELNDTFSFVRVFPWRWTGKKGSCDVEPDDLNADWHYNWNISKSSTLDWEYVAIKQQPYWPSLDQDWQSLGVSHLSGFNEPDNSSEDAYVNLGEGSIDAAIGYWPDLLATGLRVGAPAVTDGGSDWILEFMEKADEAGLRVDYVPVHYYRSYSNNDYPAGAASQLYTYLKSIYDEVKRPIWVTEFNNGANWTTDTDPTYAQNEAVVEAMIEMMDETPWIERYAIYSYVEYMRQTHYDEGGLTPMGQMYYDHQSPIAFIQPATEKMLGCAYYQFDRETAQDSLVYENHGVLTGQPDFTTGYSDEAIELDGSDDYVTLPSNMAHGDDFTFAGWIYWDGGDTWQRIFDFGTGSTEYMFLTPNSGSTLRFAITVGGYGAEQQLETSSALDTGQWVHVAVTLNGDVGKLFVNGSLVDTNSDMTINPSDFMPIDNYLGKSQFSSDPLFAGRLDDIRLADYALTDDEIAALATGSADTLAPGFTSSSITKSAVVQSNAYSDTLVYDADDADADDMLTFTKIDGPDWLTVASDGQLSGTPSLTDVGANSFTIRVTDASELTSDTTITIPVVGLSLQSQYYFEGDADDNMGDNDGTVTGDPTYSDGQIGQAIDLDGSDDYVTLPEGVADFDDITIAAWIYWDGGDVWQRIFDFGTGTTEYMFLTPDSGSGVRFSMTVGGYGQEQQLQAASELATDQWVHVAVTLEGDTGKLYVDGELEDTNESMTLNPSDFNPVYNYIGASQFSSDPLLVGSVDDFRIYNYALTETEVSALARGAVADQPFPANGQIGPVNDVLTWTAGADALSHRVYLGTDEAAVISADTESAEFMGVRHAAMYVTGELTADATYYWRVDELSEAGPIVQGPVWRFTASGVLLREVWTDIEGETVADLTDLETYPDSPDVTEYLSDFAGPGGWGDLYGSRLKGFLVPQTSGDYTFWIAGDNDCQLWLSTDATPDNAVWLASVDGSTDEQSWDEQTSQESESITLTAGQKYYIEVLHKEAYYGDHVAIAWQGPDSETRSVIAGDYLAIYHDYPVPEFSSHVLDKGTISEGQSFSANVSEEISSSDEDFVYAKVLGSQWIQVDSDGTVYGDPADADVGDAYCIVQVVNSEGVADEARLEVTVTESYTGSKGLDDLAAFAGEWLSEDSDSPANLNQISPVDLDDLTLLSEQWNTETVEGLIAQWTLDGGYGLVAQDNYGPYDGTLVNMDACQWSEGTTGGALTFDGEDDYIEITGYQGITGSQDRTCMMWIKTSAANKELLSWGDVDTSGGKWLILLNADGCLRLAVQGGYIYGTSNIADGNWHHVAVVFG